MASIKKKYALNANGILAIDGEDNNYLVSIENVDTGELIPLHVLLEDFKDRTVKLSITYDEDYE